MHLYDSRVGEFIPRASSGQIADALSRSSQIKLDRHATESEIRSWRNSLGAFADALDGVGMPSRSRTPGRQRTLTTQ